MHEASLKKRAHYSEIGVLAWEKETEATPKNDKVSPHQRSHPLLSFTSFSGFSSTREGNEKEGGDRATPVVRAGSRKKRGRSLGVAEG